MFQHHNNQMPNFATEYEIHMKFTLVLFENSENGFSHSTRAADLLFRALKTNERPKRI